MSFNPRLPVVAFTGPAGAGKTTAAKLLAEMGRHADGQESILGPLSFAKPIKSILLEQNPFVDEYLGLRLESALSRYGESMVKATFPEYRRLLQSTGEAIKRHDPEFFVQAMFQHIMRAEEDPGILCAVIDDLRFPVELHALGREHGDRLVTVRILPRGPVTPVPGQHISEIALATYAADYTIDAQDLSELKEQLEPIYNTIMSTKE